MSDGGGRRYLLGSNFGDGTLDACREMLLDPNTVAGLSDAGAHVTLICDATMPTTDLTTGCATAQGRAGAARTRGPQADGATPPRCTGFGDRGMLAPGQARRPERHRPRQPRRSSARGARRPACRWHPAHPAVHRLHRHHVQRRGHPPTTTPTPAPAPAVSSAAPDPSHPSPSRWSESHVGDVPAPATRTSTTDSDLHHRLAPTPPDSDLHSPTRTNTSDSDLHHRLGHARFERAAARSATSSRTRGISSRP